MLTGRRSGNGRLSRCSRTVSSLKVMTRRAQIVYIEALCIGRSEFHGLGRLIDCLGRHGYGVSGIEMDGKRMVSKFD